MVGVVQEAKSPHRDTGTGGSSTPRFPRIPSLATDDTMVPTAPASATLAVSSSPDETVGTATGASASGAHMADLGMQVGTGPVPTTTAPLDTEHISAFLSYIRLRTIDDATATAASAAETLTSPPPS